MLRGILNPLPSIGTCGTEKMQNCTICDGSLNVCKTLYDDRYGYPGVFSLLKCGGCGHKSLDAYFSTEELERLYTEYYPRSQFSLDGHQPLKEVSGFRSWFDGARSFAFRWVPHSVRVLDIGCGFGETLGYHKARGCDVYGVEADRNIRRVADRFGYKVCVGLFDPSQYEPDFFDYVTLDQVVEHLTDPLPFFENVARVMKQRGRLIVSTPNSNGWGAKVFGKKWVHWHAPYHLQFFSNHSMAITAEKTGFTVKFMATVTNSDWLLYQWLHMLFRPDAGTPSVFWSPNHELGSWQKKCFQIINAVHAIKVDNVVTRLFDSFGVGDNYLFVLEKN